MHIWIRLLRPKIDDDLGVCYCSVLGDIWDFPMSHDEDRVCFFLASLCIILHHAPKILAGSGLPPLSGGRIVH